MPRVAACHLRPGDRVRIGARAVRRVSGVIGMPSEQTVVTFYSFTRDRPVFRLRLLPGIRAWHEYAVRCERDVLLETTLGPNHDLSQAS